MENRTNNDPAEIRIIHLAINGRITGSIILGKNLASLEEKRQLLIAYTKKVDPLAVIQEVKIQENNLIDPKDETKEFVLYDDRKGENIKISIRDLYELGFTYYFNPIELLPRPVKTLYGSNNIGGDCISTAIIAGGISPGYSALNEVSIIFPAAKPRDMELNELSFGDIVQIGPMREFGFTSVHDFVFLDKDISISTNGVLQPFLLHPTATVLDIYNRSTNALVEIGEYNKKPMRILRKPDQWQYPEAILAPLLEFYNILITNMENEPKAAIRLQELGGIIKYFFNTIPTNECGDLIDLNIFHLINMSIPKNENIINEKIKLTAADVTELQEKIDTEKKNLGCVDAIRFFYNQDSMSQGLQSQSIFISSVSPKTTPPSSTTPKKNK